MALKSVTCSESGQSLTLTVNTVTVTRNGNTLTVAVGWETSGSAWSGWAALNGTQVHSRSNSPNIGAIDQANSGTATLTVTDSNMAAHNNTLTLLAGVQPASGWESAEATDTLSYAVPAAELPISVNVSGTIKAVQKVYANVGGTIKEITAAYVNVGGTIKQIF